MHFIKKQLDEIFGSKLLKKYGLMLAVTHFVILASWWGSFATQVFSDEALCWPHFLGCNGLHGFFANYANWYFSVYLSAIVLSCWFWFKEKKELFYLSLWALLLLKSVVVLSDYRFSGNFSYFVFIIHLLYLLAPLKKVAIPYALVLFYFFAGLLKFNKEWLSGSVFTDDPMLASKVLEVLLAYTILLEVVFVFYLLGVRKLPKRLVLFQLMVFHAYSWYFVGFLYPLTMVCLISFFMLGGQDEFLDAQQELLARIKFKKWQTFNKNEYALLASFLLFAVLQLLPRFNSNDSALTGEGRYFSLTMFDSRSICLNKSFIEGSGGIKEVSTEFDTKAEPRLHCDPILYVQHFKKLCANDATLKDPQNILNVSLFSKRTSDDNITQVLDIKNFCAQDLTFNLMGYNSWISSNVF